MHCSLFIFFAAALSGVHCIVNSGSYVVHERRQSPRPSKWIKRAKIQPHAILPIRIGLTQTSLEKAHEYLMDVSDPFSPRYGKHWTEEDIIEKFKPSEECVEAVILWLTSSGISRNRISQSNNKGWLAFDATTKESEDLFHAEFHEYEHEASGEVSVACEVYHLPKHVRLHIDYITPGIRLISMTRRVINKRKFGVQPGNTSKLKPLPIYVLSGSVGATPTEPSNRTDPNHPRPQQMATSQRLFQSLDTCSEAVTPACIQALYSIPPGTRAKPANAMGIYEYADAYDQPDLDTFFARYYPIIPKGTHPKLNSINGGVAPVAQVNRGEESLLDFQVAYPLLWPQGTVLYQVGLSATFNNLLDAIDGSYCKYAAFGEKGDDPKIDPVYPDITYGKKVMCGKYLPTNVISISYGGDEFHLPAYYQRRQCNEFMKLGLAGKTVLVASGDTGVSGALGCAGGFMFSPDWPATCPYVTSVGATKIMKDKSVTDPEVAAQEDEKSFYKQELSSGGGFSNIYPAPSYQTKALRYYFRNHKPPYLNYTDFGTFYESEDVVRNDGVYNRLGRGIPDVSAVGDNILVVSNGLESIVFGTSASTPIFGAIVNRINEERLAAKKSTIGFINPVLYAHPRVLNDITKGNNPGCGTSGFEAVKGWDPVTGLGTPNYTKMLKLWMSLP